MALVLKICGSEWENASRDKRELSVYREFGYDVAVLAKGMAVDKGRIEDVDGFKVYRYSTRPLGDRMPNLINRIISLFSWASFVRTIKPDVISGHDLMPGLTIGWLATLFLTSKPKLIYDSHEFELGRNVKRSKMTIWFTKIWEKKMIKKCAFSIMVNDSIAEEVQKIHHLKEKPIVVRSTPLYCDVDLSICNHIRQKMIDDFTQKGQLTRDNYNRAFLIMYHGALTSGRGIETLIKIVSIHQDLCGIILGNGTEKYKQSLKELIKTHDVSDRILLYNAVPADILWQYVGAVDLSLMMIQKNAKSYYYALPNKFFESIQALTPIIASNFPEMKRLIDQYGIGLACDPEDINSIIDAIDVIRNDTYLYNTMKENLYKAKAELCWENERRVLSIAFDRFIFRNA